MLEAVVDALVCPHGEAGLVVQEGGLVCPAGHRFDLARHGYVNLLSAPAPAAADTAAMVAAREWVQHAGHHAAVTEGLVRALRDALGDARPPGLVVDLGAGTGHHMSAVVDGLGARAGLALDVSKYAARRAARVHPRVGAVVCDVWQPLPVRSGAAEVVLDVFAPRNVPETMRILAAGGVLVVVTPMPDHLAPLVERLGLLHVGADKLTRLDEEFGEVTDRIARERIGAVVSLDHRGVQAMAAMGPSAHHLDADALVDRIAELPDPIEVELSVTVSTYRRRPGRPGRVRDGRYPPGP